jgi:hypothetical protein
MVQKLTGPVLTGILGAGILAAIMSSLDSQFLCLGTMFTRDIVLHHFGDRQIQRPPDIFMARGFIVLVVPRLIFSRSPSPGGSSRSASGASRAFRVFSHRRRVDLLEARDQRRRGRLHRDDDRPLVRSFSISRASGRRANIWSSA